MEATNIYDFVGNVCESLGYNYQHGSFKAIQKYLNLSLANKKDISKRFPLVALITEGMVNSEEVNPSLHTAYPLRLIIATYTKKNYNSAERLELSFKAVLWPMRDQILDQLRRYSLSEFRELPHKSQNHFYYSTDPGKSANVLNFTLDAVELTDLNLLINFNEAICD